MAHRDIVVVGGSAGATEALAEVVRGRPVEFPAAVFVVVHFPASSGGVLPKILSRAGSLPAIHADDGLAFQPGADLRGSPRLLEEHAALSRRLAARADGRGHAYSAPAFTEQAMDAEHHASTIRNVLAAGLSGQAALADATSDAAPDD